MDSPPEPRADLSAAQRIAIALGTAEPPSAEPTLVPAPESTHRDAADPESLPGTPA